MIRSKATLPTCPVHPIFESALEIPESRDPWQTTTSAPCNQLQRLSEFGIQDEKTGSLNANARPIVNMSNDVVLHSQSGKNFYTLSTPGVCRVLARMRSTCRLVEDDGLWFEGTDGSHLFVSDGDLSLMKYGPAVKVRLNGIDAPEKGQPFTNRAKQFLSELVFDCEGE